MCDEILEHCFDLVPEGRAALRDFRIACDDPIMGDAVPLPTAAGGTAIKEHGLETIDCEREFGFR